MVDGAGFHSTKEMKLPNNIRLLKLPPYCPELNPIERLWQDMKDKISWKIYDNLDILKSNVSEIILGLTKEKIKSISSFKYITKSQY